MGNNEVVENYKHEPSVHETTLLHLYYNWWDNFYLEAGV